jgi:MFS transporter, ACS family, D-galactonate transporter
LIVALATYLFFRARGDRPLRLGPPTLRLLLYSAPTAVAIIALFVVAETFRWPEWLTAIGTGVLAMAVIALVVRNVVASGQSATLLNRNIWYVYIAFVAVLWNLWFFSFWSVQIVKETAHSSLVAAGLTAAFNAGAGIIGFPVGGWLADRRARQGKGRKPLAIVCAVAHTLLATAFGLTILGGQPSLVLLGLILFTSGLFFNALQPIVHGITGDLVPKRSAPWPARSSAGSCATPRGAGRPASSSPPASWPSRSPSTRSCASASSHPATEPPDRGNTLPDEESPWHRRASASS